MRRYPVISVLCGVLALAGCGKPSDDQPAETPEVTLQLTLSFDTVLPGHKTLDYPTKAGGAMMRHIVRVYDGDRLEREQVLTSANVSAPGADLDFTLRAGRYRVLVWSDFVQGQSGQDWMWSAGNFARIGQTGSYQGATPYKDAFCGSLDVNLSSSSSYANGLVKMSRPLAKYSLTAADASLFADREITATVTYGAPVPTVYNLLEKACTDTQDAVSYTCKPEIQADGTVLLAYDYLLVTGGETTVPLTLELKEGSATLASLPLSVPLHAGRETLFKGSVFTGSTSSGIVVDPDFDGDYQIDF